MHLSALKAVLESVRRRVAQGDCPTEPPQSVETLEDALLSLEKREAQRRKILSAPDDEPTAGDMEPAPGTAK